MRSTQPPEIPHDDHEPEPAERVVQNVQDGAPADPYVHVRWKCSCGFPLKSAKEAFLHRDRSDHYSGQHHIYPVPDRRKDGERRKGERRKEGAASDATVVSTPEQ